jgi:Fur family ferric uptake transcriptional regulator
MTPNTNPHHATKAPCGRSIPKPTAEGRTSLDQWKSILASHLAEKGLKNSEQRIKIAEVLLKEPGHFRVQDVAKKVQQTFDEIGPATVYRAINLFRDAGLLKETLVGDGGETVYEVADGEHHDHIICLDCELIFEFHDETMEARQDRAAKEMGFSPERHRHVIYARCDRLSR